MKLLTYLFIPDNINSNIIHVLQIFGQNFRLSYRENISRKQDTSKVLCVTKNNIIGLSGESVGNNLNMID